jgi:hypothetical protein
MKAISTKPVKACLGCELNLNHRCAVFDHPMLKWKNRRCEGYNDPETIARYRQSLHPEGAKARKQQRAQKARQARTGEHNDGRHSLGT